MHANVERPILADVDLVKDIHRVIGENAAAEVRHAILGPGLIMEIECDDIVRHIRSRHAGRGPTKPEKTPPFYRGGNRRDFHSVVNTDQRKTASPWRRRGVTIRPRVERAGLVSDPDVEMTRIDMRGIRLKSAGAREAAHDAVSSRHPA